MVFTPRTAAVLLFLAFMASAPKLSFGARYLEIDVLHKGRPVLHEESGAPDHHSPSVVWRGLSGLPLMECNSLESDPANPLTRTLRDDVIVKIQHTQKPFVVVRTDTLTIQRRNEADQEWFISSEEVERLAKLQGLTLSWKDRLALAYDRYPNAVALGVAMVFLLPLLTLLVFRARRKGRRAAGTQDNA
jgi:hypothetical protein